MKPKLIFVLGPEGKQTNIDAWIREANSSISPARRRLSLELLDDQHQLAAVSEPHGSRPDLSTVFSDHAACDWESAAHEAARAATVDAWQDSEAHNQERDSHKARSSASARLQSSKEPPLNFNRNKPKWKWNVKVQHAQQIGLVRPRSFRSQTSIKQEHACNRSTKQDSPTQIS